MSPFTFICPKKLYNSFYGSDIKRSLALTCFVTDCDMPCFGWCAFEWEMHSFTEWIGIRFSAISLNSAAHFHLNYAFDIFAMDTLGFHLSVTCPVITTYFKEMFMEFRSRFSKITQLPQFVYLSSHCIKMCFLKNIFLFLHCNKPRNTQLSKLMQWPIRTFVELICLTRNISPLFTYLLTKKSPYNQFYSLFIN